MYLYKKADILFNMLAFLLCNNISVGIELLFKICVVLIMILFRKE